MTHMCPLGNSPGLHQVALLSEGTTMTARHRSSARSDHRLRQAAAGCSLGTWLHTGGCRHLRAGNNLPQHVDGRAIGGRWCVLGVQASVDEPSERLRRQLDVRGARSAGC